MKLADHLHACLRYWARVAVTQGVVIAIHDRCDKCGTTNKFPTVKNTPHGVADKDIRLNSGAFLATKGDRHHLHKEPPPSIDVYPVGGSTNE